MYWLNEWAAARNHPQVVSCVVHQCMTGLREQQAPRRRLKKPTDFWASSPLLLAPLQDLICDGKHEHATIDGSRSHAARVWTWYLAERIAAGVRDLVEHEARVQHHHAD